MSEVSEVCDHILIIKKGKLIGNGTPEELAAKMQTGTTLTVEVMGDENLIREALSGIEGEIKVSAAATAGNYIVEITTPEQSDLRSAVSIALSAKGLVILSMNLAQASLEDVFLELTYGDADLPSEEDAENTQESEVDAE